MSFAYLPLYTGDYLRDTQHLSCAEHGIYLKLLMHCWDAKGPAPLDERKRCGIVNARSGDEIEALRRVINEFFVEMEDGWYNERMQSEIVKVEILAKSRSEYGRIGAVIRAKSQVRRAKAACAEHKLSISQAQAKHELVTPTPTSTPTPTLYQEKSKDVSPNGDMSGKPDVAPLESKKKGNGAAAITAYLADAENVLIYLNKTAQTAFKFRNPKGALTASAEAVINRLKEGYTATQLREVVFSKAQEWRGNDEMRTYLRPDTLFGKKKFEQYLGAIGNVDE